jgi:hypothetical protein
MFYRERPGEEADTMLAHAISTPGTEMAAILGLGLAVAWLWLLCVGLLELCGQAALTVSGHFRRRADPAFERRLRAAFAELDAELAAVLGDRTGSRPRT